GARRPRKELEGMRLNAEREVAQHLRPQPIAQTYVLESNQTRLRPLGGRLESPRPAVSHHPRKNRAFTAIPRPRQNRRLPEDARNLPANGLHGFRSVNGQLVPFGWPTMRFSC